MQKVQVDDVRGRVDFAILTMREDEYEAVLERLPGRQPVSGRQLYEYAQVTTSTGAQRGVVVARTTEQGQTAAQSVTRDMIEDLDPSWIILTGIAGAVPDSEFTLGDVCLASRLHDFSVSAAVEGRESTYQQRGGPVHVDVERLLNALPAWRYRLPAWNLTEAIRRDKPAVEVPATISETSLYGSDQHRERVRQLLAHHFPAGQLPRAPRFKIGPGAGSNVLVKDTALLRRWQESARHLTHVEMEAGGVYEAARKTGKREYPLLCVRGISDIVGYARSPAWTEYACHSAASFVKALIESDMIKLHIVGTIDGASPITSSPHSDRTSITRMSLDGEPTPVAYPGLLRSEGGTMPINDPLYVRRQADYDAEVLARSGDSQTLVIKGPRQRGKSSLLVRYLVARRDRSKKIGLIDFLSFSDADLASYPEFLTSLATAVLDVLEISAPEPKIRRQMEMTRFLQRNVLENTGPLALAFDEVDRVANREYKTDFFGMLRTWHNSRAEPLSPAWRTFDLALVLSTEPELLIQDSYQSPFSVGYTIELDSLTREQCHAMNACCVPKRLSNDEVDEIYDLLGGHPYLTRFTYNRVLAGSFHLPLAPHIACDPHGPFGDHLRQMLRKLSPRQDLLAALQRIIHGNGSAVEPELVYRLRSVGLVRIDNGTPRPANLLYKMFFRTVQ